MDAWHDATILYEMLVQTLQPHERGRHVLESAAASSAEKDMDPDWHKPETMDTQETYDEVAAGFVAEDRKRMLYKKLDTELDDYYKRKYGDTDGAGAPSSSSSSSKRQAAETKYQMEVDEDAAEESVDYTEDIVEC